MWAGLNCEKCDEAWSLLARAEALATKQNGRVIGILWTDDESASVLERDSKISSSKAMISWDAHRLVPALFGLKKVVVLADSRRWECDARFIEPVTNVKE